MNKLPYVHNTIKKFIELKEKMYKGKLQKLKSQSFMYENALTLLIFSIKVGVIHVDRISQKVVTVRTISVN